MRIPGVDKGVNAQPPIWGAITLALLAYAGQIKANPLLAWVPIDLTLLMGLLVGIAVLAAVVAKHVPIPKLFVLPFTLFMLFLLPIFGSSLDTGYPRDKVITLFTFTLISAGAPFFILTEERQQRAFLITLAALGIAVAMITLVHPATVDTTDVTVFEGTDTIGTARMTATAVVICAVPAFTARIRARYRVALIVAILVLIVVTIAAGSRGPFLAVAVGLGLMILTAPGLRRIRGRAILGTVVVSAAAIIWMSREGSDGFARIFDFLNGQSDNSTRVRAFLWQQAWRQVPTQPGGIGWGNFADMKGLYVYSVSPDGTKLYPHNLITEAFIEGGWVIGAAVVVYLVAALIRARRAAVNPVTMTMYALLGFTIFNAMVSGDINDSRLMWMVLAVAFVMKVPSRSQSSDGLEYGRGGSAISPGNAPVRDQTVDGSRGGLAAR